MAASQARALVRDGAAKTLNLMGDGSPAAGSGTRISGKAFVARRASLRAFSLRRRKLSSPQIDLQGRESAARGAQSASLLSTGAPGAARRRPCRSRAPYLERPSWPRGACGCLRSPPSDASPTLGQIKGRRGHDRSYGQGAARGRPGAGPAQPSEVAAQRAGARLGEARHPSRDNWVGHIAAAGLMVQPPSLSIDNER